MSGTQYMMLSALGFALMGALVKVAGSLDIPLFQIILVRAVISVILSLSAIARAKVHPLGHRRWLLLARGVCGFLSLSCVFYAVLHLPFAEATILQYLHPVFTAVLAFILLREVPGKGTLICVLLSLGGLGVMLLPTAGVPNADANWLAVLAGLGGAFGSGLAYTIVRKLASTEHPSVIVLYFPMVCIPASVLVGFEDFIWPSQEAWLVLFGVGCFAQLGQLTLTKAMRTDSASRAASLSYVQIVFAALLGIWFFDELPTLYTMLGAALIILGAVINTLIKVPPGGTAASGR